VIVGAGFSGLIAAHVFPSMPICDAAPEPKQGHQALLRFRSDAVAKLTGIDFKAVDVHKGIYFRGSFHEPNIQLANLYSRKVIDSIADRSVWDISTRRRYIAPENFHEQLLDAVGSRITWGLVYNYDEAPLTISTAPLPNVLAALQIHTGVTWSRSPITVRKFRIPDSDVYQTIYFPSTQHSLYRASITGDVLIAEHVGHVYGEWMAEMLAAFGLDHELEWMGDTEQSYGKIAEVDNDLRKSAIHRLSAEHNIFSVGRFATWKNILLDDVVDDAWKVKRLINASRYDRQLGAIK